MAVRIASNISSLISQRRLNDATRDLGSVSEKLSSGLRINKASDDAAGLQIAEGLSSDSKVYGQAIRNVNDGLSLLNIAQGATQQLSNIVIRQAELAEQATNGAYSYKQRLAMNAEANALVREYNRITQTTSFNGIQTLSGVTNALRMQLGYGTDGGINVGVGNNIGFAAGDAEFGTQSSILSGLYSSNSSDLNVEDINGDSNPDLMISRSGTFEVLIGNGDGSFRAPTSIETTLSNLTYGDFNNDAILDVAGTTGNTIRVLLGNGDGTFLAAVSYTNLSSGIVDSQAADINKDGIIDLVSATATASRVMIGNGDGTFQLPTTMFNYGAAGGSVLNLEVADLNGDGYGDIISANQTGGRIVMQLGNGDGSFLAPISLQGGVLGYDVALADFNNDGQTDIVATDVSSNRAVFLFGNGDGTFLARRSFTIGVSTASTINTADFNGDGIRDVIAIDGSTYAAWIMTGNGDGSFSLGRSYVSGGASKNVTVEDLNNDGIIDLVAPNGASSTLVISLGEADESGRRNNRLEALDLTTRYGAKQALASSKAALVRIGAELGNLGAMQSRLSVASQNLSSAREAFFTARSQLVDADIAQESAKLVSTKIRQQGAAAVLAQSNQQPSLALKRLER